MAAHVLLDYMTEQQSRFTKCTICTHIRKEMGQSNLANQTRQQLALRRKIHLTQQL